MPRYRDREGRLHSTAESRIDRVGGGAVGPAGPPGPPGGAPSDATFLTLSLNATLTDERVFTPSDGLIAVDGGVNAAYTLKVSDLYHPFLLMGG